MERLELPTRVRRALMLGGIADLEDLRKRSAKQLRVLPGVGSTSLSQNCGRADLLLLDADPRADLDALRKREGAMVRGRWYSQATVNTLTAQIRRS